jgi:hypothetical protein
MKVERQEDDILKVMKEKMSTKKSILSKTIVNRRRGKRIASSTEEKTWAR